MGLHPKLVQIVKLMMLLHIPRCEEMYSSHIVNLFEKIRDTQADIKMACAKEKDDWTWILLWLGGRAKVEVPAQFELNLLVIAWLELPRQH